MESSMEFRLSESNDLLRVSGFCCLGLSWPKEKENEVPKKTIKTHTLL
jgi:hypothetical protein